MNLVQSVKDDFRASNVYLTALQQIDKCKRFIEYAEDFNARGIIAHDMRDIIIQAMRELIAELETLGESETWQGDEQRNSEGRNA